MTYYCFWPIEVPAALDGIDAAATGKSTRHGQPRPPPRIWARVLVPAKRALLFAQIVKDRGYRMGDGSTRGADDERAARGNAESA